MDTPLGPHPVIGDKLGRFTLVAPLGAGGMASVFRAQDPHGDAYAVKILNPARVLPEDLKRFTREFQALSKMDHPHIVRVYSSGVHEGYPWIAMEVVEGGDLEGLIERWRLAPPPDRFARIETLLEQLCGALQYIHDRNLVHRDLKPSNILITADGLPKISDFGVVKGAGDGNTHITQLTMAGRLVGTVAYMAPELITEEAVDTRADLYSLGAILYLMLCFRRPIEAKSVAGYLARHLTEVPTPPGQLDPSIPRRIENICTRLLQKDRAQRYSSASAVQAALHHEGEQEVPPLQGRERLLKAWTRRLQALQDGGGGVVIVNGPTGGGKTHLITTMIELGQTHGLKVLPAVGWTHDPLIELARHADLDAEGSLGGGLHRAILASLKDRPSILAVDDLDRAPRRTIEALARLMRQACAVEGRPVLLLATGTSLDAISTLVNGHATGMPADLFPVGAVDEQAAISMIRDRGVLGAAGNVLGRRLHEAFGGLPGPMVEQLQSLVDEGWFQGPSDDRQLRRSMTELRQGDFPVPHALTVSVLETLEPLAVRDRQLLEVLAVLDRPAGPTLLSRCTREPVQAVRSLEELSLDGWLDLNDNDEGDENYSFRNPLTARVLRASLQPGRKQEIHRTLADALGGRRRRTASMEVAIHLDAAGDAAAAYPLYVASARRLARKGTAVEILDVCRRAAGVQDEAERSLPEEESTKLREVWRAMQGQAHLERQAWDEAAESLKIALSAARSTDSGGLGAILAGLGRAVFRSDDHRRARPLLEEAMTHLASDATERGPALRALADIHLQSGEFAASNALWTEALTLACAQQDGDAEARARRGLAHLRVLEGRLSEGMQLLDEADDLLALQGDPRVRAGVLTWAIELAALTGNAGTAVRRAEQLVDLARRRELSERLPDAYGLLAWVLYAMGDRDEALDAATQAGVFAAAHPQRFNARLRATRVLLDLGLHQEAAELLPDAEELPNAQIDDLIAGQAALRARLLAPTDPTASKDLAIWSLQRPPPMLQFQSATIALDAAKALLAAGHASTARTAAKRGLKILQGLGADGLRLEILLALYEASPDERVKAAGLQVAERVSHRLEGRTAESFAARVRAALP